MDAGCIEVSKDRRHTNCLYSLIFTKFLKQTYAAFRLVLLYNLCFVLDFETESERENFLSAFDLLEPYVTCKTL